MGIKTQDTAFFATLMLYSTRNNSQLLLQPPLLLYCQCCWRPLLTRSTSSGSWSQTAAQQKTKTDTKKVTQSALSHEQCTVLQIHASFLHALLISSAACHDTTLLFTLQPRTTDCCNTLALILP